ncbi:MAG: hypothetical protein EBW87_01770 [Burkholderiaceae bacterium]|nr:hypothetical protein [Burkholderiaceae bacterium]
MNINQVLTLAKQFDGNIPKLIAILNDPTLTQLAGLQHLEPQREALVADLNFIKSVVDVLLSLFPAA